MKKFAVKVYAKIDQTINFPRRAKLLQQLFIMQKLNFYNNFFITQKFMVKIWIWPPLNSTPIKGPPILKLSNLGLIDIWPRL